MPKGIKYSKQTYKRTAQFKLNKDILNAETRTPNLNKEIQRIFHAANRRLQNIEKSGLESPAARALQFDDLANMQKFAKFTSVGKDWTDIKIEYAKAVQFLKNPLSTATGVKEFYKEIQKSFPAFKNEKLSEISNLIARQPQTFFNIGSPQRKAMEYFETSVKDVSEQIETAAERLENYIDLREPIKNDMSENYLDMNESELKFILDGLKDFGL